MHRLQTRLEAVEQCSHPVERQPRWWQSLSGPMTRAAAGLLAVAVFLTGLLSAAPASAVDPRIPLSAETQRLTGYCEGFTAVITYTAFNQYIVSTTTALDGTTTVSITGKARATVTNQTTGKSVSYNISGPGTVVFYPDGAFDIDAGGPNLLWTTRVNLGEFSYVPTISYTTGHVTVEVDASGLTTDYALVGGARQTDVCAVLAS
jgi:hypothetical protein